MNSSGQYFIDNSKKIQNGTAEVGLYGLGNAIAQVLYLVVLSMNYAYQPLLFKKLSEGLKNKLHKTTGWYILAVCSATALLIVAGIPILFHFFIGPKYAGAQKYAYMLCAGCFMWGIYNALQVYLIYINRKGLIMIIALLGMLLSLSLNFYMVPHYGAEGAAISSIITYSVMAITCFLLVRKYYILKHE
jgi:O-antigen/teichoic acid export membrane protein